MRKRILALCLASVILANAIICPPRAKAVSLAGAALTAVGFTACVLAFLNASHVYPYNAGSGTYEQWEEDSLQGLITDYNSDTSNAAYPLTGETVRGYVTGGTICLLHNSWTVLRNFALWIVSKFGLTDNQTGVQLGVASTYLPYFASAPTAGQLRADGLYLTYDDYSYTQIWVGGAVSDASAYMVGTGPQYQITYVSATQGSAVYYTNQGRLDSDIVGPLTLTGTYLLSGATYYYTQSTRITDRGVGFFSAVPIVATLADAIADYASYTANVAGMTVDTGAVSIPDELPEDKDWGGLAVAGGLAGIAGGLAAILDILRQGVGDRTQPAVTPVDVTIAEGTEVVDETGEVIQDVVIGPEFIDFSPGEFEMPDLTGVFPFSIPWDLVRIFSALDAPPQRPEYHADLIPAGTLYPGQPAFHVDIVLPESLGDRFDNVAFMIRMFLLVITCIGFTVWIGKFIDF